MRANHRGASRPQSRFRLFAALVTAIAVTAGAPSAAAEPAEPSSLRLFAAASSVTVPGWGLPGELGLWIAPTQGAFEIRVTRSSYAEPIVASQVDPATGEILRTIPDHLLEGWFGLRGFLHVVVRNDAGRRVLRTTSTLCPNGWDLQRVNDEGPIEPTYPYTCAANPFTRGSVWGIPEGWATNAAGDGYGFFGGPGFFVESPSGRVAPGHYTARAWIAREYRALFGIADADAEVTIDVTVKGRDHGESFRPAEGSRAESERVPDMVEPDPDLLPDLQALPAWNVHLFGRERRAREQLGFAANAWNAGPAPLVVEGFRRSGEDVMDAYQYFYESGEPVGRAPAGTMEYDARDGHDHWHFLQFVSYQLLDGTRTEVVRSGKQAFCLAPTDAIDLTVEGAQWATYGLGSWCGRPGSIWIRETLEAGWGDTYYQFIPGQSFDVTGLPNGKYFIRVEVNPLGSLVEADTSNNVSLRKIRIRGRPGHRRAIVPPYEGLDTEGCFFC